MTDILGDKRIRIFAGHFGSGKTEVSVNYALKIAEAIKKDEIQGKVAIADIDVANPYFRSREKEEMLSTYGIESFSSVLKNSSLDLPALSANLVSPIIDERYHYVIDVGGDEIGARVLGYMSANLQDTAYDLFMVINVNREFTDSVEKIETYIEAIEYASKLRVTGIINNTHLLWDTTADDILKGDDIAQELSSKTGIPYRYVSFYEKVDIKKIQEKLRSSLFPIRMVMRENWM